MPRKTKKPHSSRLDTIKRQKILYLVVPIIIVGVYLNTANNHFYSHLHNSGLPWPQNEAEYKIGEANGQPIKYVAIGDSLTSGVGATNFEESYSYKTAELLLEPNQSISLIPLSYPGFKSEDVVNNYLDKAIKLQPDIITILIGANDVHGLKPSSKKFTENYDQILSRLSNETNAEIYAIAIPSIGTNSLIWPPYRNYYNQRTKLFNNNILNLTKKYGVNYIDLYNPTLRFTSVESDYYSKDDFHPSAKGYSVWAELIKNGINR